MGYPKVVWIDRHEARVMTFPDDDAGEGRQLDAGCTLVRYPMPADFSAVPLEYDFLERVKLALADAGAILVAGPGSAKAELVAHIRQHDQAMGRRITGVEPLDEPRTGRLIALARRLFGSRHYACS